MNSADRTGRTTPGVSRPRLAFPTEPDPLWTPQDRDRWEQARQVADAHPGTPGQGGWTVERLPLPVGPVVALVVAGAGGLGSVLVVLHGVTPYAGIGGVVASGLAGMVLAWHLPPADLALAPKKPKALQHTGDELLAVLHEGLDR